MLDVAREPLKHVHITLPYSEWKRVQHELVERDQTLSTVIRRFLVREFAGKEGAAKQA